MNDFGQERVIVALDHLNGEIMIQGWKNTTSIGIDEAILKFLDFGVKFFLITSITKDGTLMGPDYEALTRASNHPRIKIIAAGGVSNIKEFTILKKIGVYGVVIGKALYEGVFNLSEVLKICK